MHDGPKQLRGSLHMSYLCGSGLCSQGINRFSGTLQRVALALHFMMMLLVFNELVVKESAFVGA